MGTEIKRLGIISRRRREGRKNIGINGVEGAVGGQK
jgi:hypothetical protein